MLEYLSDSTLKAIIVDALEHNLKVQSDEMLRFILTPFNKLISTPSIKSFSTPEDLPEHLLEFFYDKMDSAVQQKLKDNKSINLPLSIVELLTIIDSQVKENLLLVIKNIDPKFIKKFKIVNNYFNINRFEILLDEANQETSCNQDIKRSVRSEPFFFKSQSTPVLIPRTISYRRRLSECSTDIAIEVDFQADEWHQDWGDGVLQEQCVGLLEEAQLDREDDDDYKPTCFSGCLIS